jgi:hypothetical protein
MIAVNEAAADYRVPLVPSVVALDRGAADFQSGRWWNCRTGKWGSVRNIHGAREI